MSWYEKEECVRTAYFFLMVVRFFWTLLPQTGYIFPDEFFQSPEIMAKDFLSLNTTVTWEWNETFPLRSPVSAFLTSGIPYMILNALCNIKLIKLNSYLLLVFPRVYITLLSILSFDLPVYALCRRFKLDPFSHLFVLSTCYVTLVFGTRPFSNVLETSIFGILLLLLVVPRNENCPQLHNNKPTSEEKVGVSISNVQCILAGSLTALGIFCRPTFPVFALIPYTGFFIRQLWWQNNPVDSAKFLHVFVRMMLMGFGFLVVSLLIVLLDSWYFGYLQKGSIVFTPWNFIKYNTMQAHKHGYHPVFTHFFVNIPLLFGPVAFLYYFKFGSLLTSIWQILQGYYNKQQCSIDKQVDLDYKFYQAVLMFAAFVPVLLLSVIPHQEPRFIMPIILPLILLFSHNVVGSKHSPTVFLSWCIWNVIGCLLFGVLHQGGVIPSLLHLEKVINNNVKSSSTSFCHHIVYFHTYMPATHLLAWPNKISVKGHQLYIHDLAGSSQEVFHQTKLKLGKEYCDKNLNMLYVICPGTVKISIEGLLNVTNFFPHLTMEDPPDFNHYLMEVIFGNPDSSFLSNGFSNYEQDVSSDADSSILKMLKMYFYNSINQFEQLKSDLSLKLYISQL